MYQVDCVLKRAFFLTILLSLPFLHYIDASAEDIFPAVKVGIPNRPSTEPWAVAVNPVTNIVYVTNLGAHDNGGVMMPVISYMGTIRENGYKQHNLALDVLSCLEHGTFIEKSHNEHFKKIDHVIRGIQVTYPHTRNILYLVFCTVELS
jgi:DNA-binding beta-propeller fold protein YncE